MTNDPTLEHIIVSTETDKTNKLKRFLDKHKTTLALGAALAVSVTINVVRKPLPKIADANWYALTREDVEHLNGLLENDPDFNKF